MVVGILESQYLTIQRDVDDIIAECREPIPSATLIAARAKDIKTIIESRKEYR